MVTWPLDSVPSSPNYVAGVLCSSRPATQGLLCLHIAKVTKTNVGKESWMV